MNKVIIMGRLTADPELRKTPTGKAAIQFTVAVNRRFSQKKETDFIKCIAWEKTAEFVSRYFSKGSMIAIVGEIRTRTYDDQNNQRHYVTEILVTEAYFTGEKSKNDGYNQQAPYYGSGQQYNNGAGGNYGFDDFTPINEENEDYYLPF